MLSPNRAQAIRDSQSRPTIHECVLCESLLSNQTSSNRGFELLADGAALLIPLERHNE
jgi:hypothetical protein